MKRTDLEKLKALKLDANLRGAPVPTRFADGAAAIPDKRERRRLDQAAGLVPFATKLPSELIQRLHEAAKTHDLPLNQLVAALLESGLQHGLLPEPADAE